MMINALHDEAAASARAAIVADGRLTFAAMGLLLVILDHAPAWSVNFDTLSRWTQDRRGERGEGHEALRLLLAELESHGYLICTRPHSDDDRLICDVIVNAVPTEASRQGNKHQVLYVIGHPQHRIAKIGITTNLSARLRAIQTGHPFRLEVLWSCPGGRRLEAWLHEGLALRRLKGEWFDFEEFDPVLVVKDGVRRARMMGVE